MRRKKNMKMCAATQAVAVDVMLIFRWMHTHTVCVCVVLMTLTFEIATSGQKSFRVNSIYTIFNFDFFWAIWNFLLAELIERIGKSLGMPVCIKWKYAECVCMFFYTCLIRESSTTTRRKKDKCRWIPKTEAPSKMPRIREKKKDEAK